ncbi:MAG TPA: glycosyltransferase family 39 protein, partial [Bacteroidota bacterium]|nr:glycosyltransferase family 39 protein [Bacteroidota bacterium]
MNAGNLSAGASVPTRRVVLILCLAFLIRVTSVLLNPHEPVSDEMEYHRLAVSLVADHSYSIDGVPTAYRAPGYPAFLAVVYAVVGPAPLAAKFVQALLDAITAGFLFLLGRKSSDISGMIAATLWCIFPPAILYVNYLLSESLAIFLITLALLLLIDAPLERISLRWLLLGLTIGCLILTKPIFLPLPFLLLAFGRKLNLSRVHGIALIGAIVLVLAPWIARNSVVMGQTGLSTNGGINLFIGNNPDATGSFQGRFPPELASDAIDEVTRNQLAFSLGIDYILRHPATFMINGAKKIAHVFRTEGDVLIGSFPRSAATDTAGFRERYASLPVIPVVLTNAGYFSVVLLAIAGIFRVPRNASYWFAAALFVTILAVHSIYFGGSRYHYPL